MATNPGMALPSSSRLCRYPAIIYVPSPYLRHSDLPIAVVEKIKIMSRLLQEKLRIAFSSKNPLNYTIVHSPDPNSQSMAEMMNKHLDGFKTVKLGKFKDDDEVASGMTTDYVLGLAAENQILVLIYPACPSFVSQIVRGEFEIPASLGPHLGDAGVIFPRAHMFKILREADF